MSAVKSSSAYQPVEPNSAYKDPEVRSRMLRELHPVQPITPPIVSPKIDPRELLTLVAQLAWAMEGMSSRVTSAMQQLAEYAVICEVQDRRIRVLEELAGQRRVAKEHRRMNRAEEEAAARAVSVPPATAETAVL